MQFLKTIQQKLESWEIFRVIGTLTSYRGEKHFFQSLRIIFEDSLNLCSLPSTLDALLVNFLRSAKFFEFFPGFCSFQCSYVIFFSVLFERAI